MCLAFASFAVCGILTAAALQVHGAAAVALQLRLAVAACSLRSYSSRSHIHCNRHLECIVQLPATVSS